MLDFGGLFFLACPPHLTTWSVQKLLIEYLVIGEGGELPHRLYIQGGIFTELFKNFYPLPLTFYLKGSGVDYKKDKYFFF